MAETVIDQDVTLEREVENSFESNEEIAYVRSQLENYAGTVKLVENAIDGKYALKVEKDSGADHIEYELYGFASFLLSKYNLMHLSIKPGADAEWIAFYVNDEFVKRLEVGNEIKRDSWNEVKIDLRGEGNTSCESFKVRTNTGSVWVYDNLYATKMEGKSLNLSNFTNDGTIINANNQLQILKHATKNIYHARSIALFDDSKNIIRDGHTITSITIDAEDDAYENISDSNRRIYTGITNPVVKAMSGNGEYIYYNYSNTLYTFNTNTLVSKYVMGVKSTASVNTNVDGSKACISDSNGRYEYDMKTDTIQTVME